MSWLKKLPWISLPLLLLTYGSFGWIYSSWIIKSVAQEQIFLSLESSTAINALYGLGVFWIILMATLITAPIAVMTMGIGTWLKSETRAFFSIFFGAFAFTLVIQRVDYFAKFLVLLAAALLFKLDLQLIGCKKWLSTIILAVFCLLGFSGGIAAFFNWGLANSGHHL